MKQTAKRTKIITTIGPATSSEEMIDKLFQAGMNTIRLNFSHGDKQEQSERVDMARAVSAKNKMPISIMLDTKGPEIRVGKMADGAQAITAGQEVTFYTDDESYKSKECQSGEFTTSYDMSKDIEPGKIILLDDGKLQVEATEVTSGVIKAKALNSHTVKTNKRINLPGTVFSMPFLSEKDINDVRLAAELKLDMIAASFVNTPEDILQIREILEEEGYTQIDVIAKIESQYAVDHIDEIIAVADGIMVARGDLGLEIPYYEVPVAQKAMIRKCRRAGKIVIVATQMLDSMEQNPSPTRAEVTDVYLATELGADATMLSGESAAGKFPVEAVETMATINMRAEKEFYNKTFYRQEMQRMNSYDVNGRTETASIIANITAEGNYKYAIVRTRTGKLLGEVSKFRPNVAIIGVTPDQELVTKFGARSSVFMSVDTTFFDRVRDDREGSGMELLKSQFEAESGEYFIVVDNHGITRHKIA